MKLVRPKSIGFTVENSPPTRIHDDDRCERSPISIARKGRGAEANDQFVRASKPSATFRAAIASIGAQSVIAGFLDTALALTAASLSPPGEPQATPRSASPPLSVAVPPSVYQREGEKTDVFAHLALMQHSVEQLPKTNIARRAAMVADIRRNVAAAGSSFDMIELDRVLSVVDRVEREKFVAHADREIAYIPFPLPIGYGQTISDSYIVAVMTAAIRPRQGQRVLDVGTGSGYQAAILSRMVGSVASIEIVEPLARAASRRLKHLGYRNVHVIAGDGFAGVPANAPFDAIVVAAGAAAIPQPLIDQLKPGGSLVMPVGPTTFAEQLILLTKRRDGTLERCSLGPATFVPFTGRAQIDATPVSKYPTPQRLCYNRPVT